MEAKAAAKYVGTPPTEAGVVLNLIKGKNVNEAFAISKYTPRDIAEVTDKVLKSVVASAESNHELGANRLFVAEAHIDHGPILKGFRPMDYGRAFRVNRRTNNITLVAKERA